MDSVEFQGNQRDLHRFANGVLKQPVTIDRPSPFEHRLRWDLGGNAGVGSTMDLRSGLKLTATKLRWDRPWAFGMRDAPTGLKFMVGRGAAPRMTLPNGSSYLMGGRLASETRHASREHHLRLLAEWR